MDDTQTQAACDAFVAAFLPPGVASSHDLLYPLGHDEAGVWVPTQVQADACIAAFHGLLQPMVQAGTRPLAIQLPFEVTELVLSYLVRLQPARAVVPQAMQLARRLESGETINHVPGQVTTMSAPGAPVRRGTATRRRRERSA